ncbi:hypothetical protein HF086_018228 [Spodoptera exigua]|uniref:BZIP domain-containing protein n=1 Tax=Spodoptera exigua TaxID=7107 RepID=A0A922MKW9_SPOEX|nr:hypothetical protein HF086_018228 [Spodoptera exigua]
MASFWKPYTPDQEQALDLSRPAVKAERVSPLPAQSAPSPPVPVPEMYPAYIGHPDAVSVYPEAAYYSYNAVYQQTPYPVSTVSPVSGHSSDLLLSATQDCDTASIADDLEYQAFEQDAMRAMAEKNGGSLLGNNPRMKRAVQGTLSADDTYKKQRERNNVAAKASRDRRKLREVKLALQTTFLKKKVAELRARLAAGLCNRCRQRCDC